MRLAIIVAMLTLTVLGCTNSYEQNQSMNGLTGQAIRPLNQDEKSADFDQLIQMFKTYYGPYQYKENRLGISIEQIGQKLKAQALSAKTDEEFMGYIMQFGAALQDGHVQFRVENSASNIRRYSIPIALTAIEDKAIVVSISKELSDFTGIKTGDEITEVDGQSPFEILKIATKYKSFATDLSNKAFVMLAFSRSSFMTELIPHKTTALVKAVKKNGETLVVDIPWTLDKYTAGLDSLVHEPAGVVNLSVPFADEFNSIMPAASLSQMGQVDPIFVTSQTQSMFGFVKVFPSPASMIKFGLKGDEKPGIYAALYKFSGKTVLLVRSASYAQSDYRGDVYIKAYMALLSEYENLADVLVLDQTHNPGGSYCASFYDIFAQAGDVQGVQKLRADRKWINDLYINWPASAGPTGNPWDVKQLLAWGTLVEKAYDNGDFLSEPVPLFSGSTYAANMGYKWKKPMLVLIDELAGSCGDMFPMLVKANNRAKLFGQRTMGLGGNVEPVGQLNNSRIAVSLTRGLFYPHIPNGQPKDSDYIENNGVTPDYEYAHTVSDFRNGYFNYVQSFSQKAIEQIK